MVQYLENIFCGSKKQLTYLIFPPDALTAGASQFETNAARLKRKMWWQNCKVRPYAYTILP